MSESDSKIMGDTLACRLCLSTNVKLLDMFNRKTSTAGQRPPPRISTHVMTITDGLPSYVCNLCSALLIKSVTFKRMCKISQELLMLGLSQGVLSTDYVESLKILHPFPLTTQTNDVISCNEQVIKDEDDWDWDYDQDYKTKESESSDEEPLSCKVKKCEPAEDVQSIKEEESISESPKPQDEDSLKLPKSWDNDFPNGEVDVLILTKEEQMAEVISRRTSTNYLNSFYKCEMCYKGFITDTTYKNHMARHDPSSGIHECEVCHMRFPHTRSLRAHIASSHEQKFVCKLCTFVSKSRYRAKEHSKWHSGHTFACKYCGATFAKSTSHLTHIRLHHPSKHTCFVCGESFIGENGLNMHYKKAHRGVKHSEASTKRCTNCEVRFHNNEALKRHTEGKAECDPSLSPCGRCGENFNTSEELKEHTKEHTKEEQVKCEECNRTFAHERSYAVHYQRVHLRVRAASRDVRGKSRNTSRVCEVCGRKCISNASLRYHQRIHTGERPYQCNQCPKRFSISQRLQVFMMKALYQIHQRTHTGERPFKCSICPKAFKHKAALNRHDRVHTGAKPYSCAHCDKSFSQSNSMKVHVRTVHWKQPSPYRARRPAVE